MARARAAKGDREIRTGDKELKAIHTIQKVLAGLDTQSAGRVLTFCIDRARQDFEQGLKADVGQAAKRLTKEAVPAVVEPAHQAASVPEPALVGA